MNNIRVLLSIITFSISCYFIVDIFIFGLNWLLLLFSILGFISVHYLWPPKYNGDSEWYDVLENIVDLPFRLIALFIRSLGSILKNSDSDLGL